MQIFAHHLPHVKLRSRMVLKALFALLEPKPPVFEGRCVVALDSNLGFHSPTASSDLVVWLCAHTCLVQRQTACSRT